jgi:hypothetical protein
VEIHIVVEDFIGFRICKSYFWEAEEGHRIDD